MSCPTTELLAELERALKLQRVVHVYHVSEEEKHIFSGLSCWCEQELTPETGNDGVTGFVISHRRIQ